jgi:putative tricarboxylic transport membrane protein
VSGVLLVALGAYIVLQARNWSFLTADGPGPGFMPIGVGAALMLLAAAQVLGALRRSSRSTPAELAVPASDGERSVPRALASWVAFAIAIALVKPLGFLLSFGLLAFFLVTVMYRQSLLKGVLVATLSALGFYLVFDVALRITLPAGFLGI